MMTIRKNPALYTEYQNQPAKIVSATPRESLLSWLERSNRFRTSEVDDFPDQKLSDELDDILDSETYISEHDEEES